MGDSELAELVRELSARVQTLEDQEAIRVLHARYAEACDDGYDPDALIALFTEDAVWDGGETLGVKTGAEEIKRFFAAASDRFKWAVHYMVAPVTEIASDHQSARGTWYLFEPCTLEEEGGREAHWVAAVYDASYVKRDGRWLFSRLNVNVRMLAPYSSGWAAA